MCRTPDLGKVSRVGSGARCQTSRAGALKISLRPGLARLLPVEQAQANSRGAREPAAAWAHLQSGYSSSSAARKYSLPRCFMIPVRAAFSVRARRRWTPPSSLPPSRSLSLALSLSVSFCLAVSSSRGRGRSLAPERAHALSLYRSVPPLHSCRSSSTGTRSVTSTPTPSVTLSHTLASPSFPNTVTLASPSPSNTVTLCTLASCSTLDRANAQRSLLTRVSVCIYTHTYTHIHTCVCLSVNDYVDTCKQGNGGGRRGCQLP